MVGVALVSGVDVVDVPGGSVALEALYRAVQANHRDLPDCVIITGTGFRGRSQVWGHFRADAWRPAAEEEARVVRRPELFIAGETLAMGPEHTLGVLLHEAVHALCAVRGVKDTSRQGRYHNRRFLEVAETFGLEHRSGRPDPTHGLNDTVLAEGTAARYREELVWLDAALPLYLDTLHRLGMIPTNNNDDGDDNSGDGEGQGDGTSGSGEASSGDRPVKRRGNQRATCGCGRIIRASAAVLDAAPIVCAACGSPFTTS
jgi:hypothetical protein